MTMESWCCFCWLTFDPDSTVESLGKNVPIHNLWMIVNIDIVWTRQVMQI